jgi:hypothetical protein
MSIAGLPFWHSMAGARGDAATESIPVGGIKATDYLLAVIAHDAANGSVQGLDITDFTVGAGTIEAGTIDTSDLYLWVLWTDVEPPEAES